MNAQRLPLLGLGTPKDQMSRDTSRLPTMCTPQAQLRLEAQVAIDHCRGAPRRWGKKLVK